MRITHYSEEKLKKEIIRIVSQYLDLEKYKIFFFGSRVRKDNSSRSDIDVGIEGPNPIPIEIMAKIREEVSDLPILYRIDVVDFNNVSKNFYKIAKEHVEPFE